VKYFILCRAKESHIVEEHLMSDHVHICISIPPKYSVSHVVDFIKGKGAIAMARKLARQKKFTSESFWVCGYFVTRFG